MFKETISQIDHEVDWINYELGRQSTSEKQSDNLKKRKDHLLAIKLLCQDYENGKYLDHNCKSITENTSI